MINVNPGGGTGETRKKTILHMALDSKMNVKKQHSSTSVLLHYYINWISC